MIVILRRGAMVYSSRVMTRRFPHLAAVRGLHASFGGAGENTSLQAGGVSFVSNRQRNVHNGDQSSDPAAVSAVAASAQWRKKQLNQITDKFHDNKGNDDNVEEDDDDTEEEEERDVELDSEGIPVIKSDEDVQEMWRAMESRVTKRTSLTLAERGGKIGRRNIRKTEEEEWLQAGLYDIRNEDDDDDDDDKDPAPHDSNAK